MAPSAADKFGEVSERLKEHAWKVCKSKGFEGSNPSLTAKQKTLRCEGFCIFGERDENPGSTTFVRACWAP